MISKQFLVLGFAVLTMGYSQAQNPFYTGSGDIYYNNGNVGIGTTAPSSTLSLESSGQKLNFLSGSNSSAYTLNVGINDDGINFSNTSGTSHDRGYIFSNSQQTIHLLAGNSSSGYTMNIGINDDGSNFENNTTSRGFNFKNSNGTLLTISDGGNVGIGTSSPSSRLSLESSGQKLNFLTGSNSSAYTLSVGINDDGINFSNNSGTSHDRGYIFSNSQQAIHLLAGNSSTSYTMNIGINDDGSNFENNTTSRGFNFKNSNGTLVSISKTGKVGIGTDQFSGNGNYNLFVINGIRTEEVLVDVCDVNGWCDYVFEDDYALMPLSEVEQYIKAKKHLPEIPSADEVVENGVKLKEMNALLLKKVEELTLYIIDQELRITTLEKRLEQ